MANPEHLELARRGTESIRAWREKHPDVKNLDLGEANLSQADLSGANLREADLSGANLSGINLSRANLIAADLSGANLSAANVSEGDRMTRLRVADLSAAKLTGAYLNGADLRFANLATVDLRGADLSAANLTMSKLSGADLTGCNLAGANLTAAVLDGAKLADAKCALTLFANVDVSEVRGLDTVMHLLPSTIGVDTLYRSSGKIPATFLRRSGIPDELINSLPSLVGSQKAASFYSCFISYSHKDEAFAKRLHSRMQTENLRVWYAPEDMKGGELLVDQITRGIRTHDKLLLVLSDNSMESQWVATEIRRARKTERETGHRKLFPIRLVHFEAIRKWECFDADSGKDLGVELREYFIPDFSNWNNTDAFEAAFARLLKDLRAEEKAETAKSAEE